MISPQWCALLMTTRFNFTYSSKVRYYFVNQVPNNHAQNESMSKYFMVHAMNVMLQYESMAGFLFYHVVMFHETPHK